MQKKRTIRKFFHRASILGAICLCVFALSSSLLYAATFTNPFFGPSGNDPYGQPSPANYTGTGYDPYGQPNTSTWSNGVNSFGQPDTSSWFNGDGGYLKSCPASPTGDFVSVIRYVLCFVNNSVIPLLVVLTMIVFLWFTVRYILSTGDKAKREEASKYILWSVVAFFVIISMWVLEHILSNTFNLDLAGPGFFATDPNNYTCPAGFPTSPNLADLVNFVTCRISDLLVPLLVVIAVLLFVYGIFRYMSAANNEKDRKAGSFYMLWGIIALFVILSVWGLVGILRNTFHVSAIPQFDGKW